EQRGRVALTPFLDLVFVKNTGVSYGLFVQEGTRGQWLLTACAAVAVVAMAVWLGRLKQGTPGALSPSLRLGGGPVQALQRVWLGGVADFFSLHAFGFYWYVFNVADVAIVAGVVGLLYDAFMPRRNGAAKSA